MRGCFGLGRERGAGHRLRGRSGTAPRQPGGEHNKKSEEYRCHPVEQQVDDTVDEGGERREPSQRQAGPEPRGRAGPGVPTVAAAVRHG